MGDGDFIGEWLGAVCDATLKKKRNQFLDSPSKSQTLQMDVSKKNLLVKY